MNFSGLSEPVDAEAAGRVVAAKEVCLEEKSITRLVDPPLFATDLKELIVSGRLNKRSIESTCTIVVCLLALCCCLFAKGQNDRLQAELTRLNNSYSSEASWESADRMRLEKELSAARLQLEALTKSSRDLDSVVTATHYRLPFRRLPAPTPLMNPPVPAAVPVDGQTSDGNSSSSSALNTSTLQGNAPLQFPRIEQ